MADYGIYPEHITLLKSGFLHNFLSVPQS